MIFHSTVPVLLQQDGSWSMDREAPLGEEWMYGAANGCRSARPPADQGKSSLGRQETASRQWSWLCFMTTIEAKDKKINAELMTAKQKRNALTSQ